MGHQIIKQPDGRLAVFSSVTDSWILTNASPEELADYYAERAAQEARELARVTIGLVMTDQPVRAYYQFAMSVREADEAARKQGNKTLQETLEEGDRAQAAGS